METKENAAPFAEDIQELIRKASEAGGTIISETTKFFSQLSGSKMNAEEFAASQRDLYVRTVNDYMKLSIQHTKNLIDLSVSFSKSMAESVSCSNEDNGMSEMNPIVTEAAITTQSTAVFELRASGQAGTAVTLAFVLHSDRKENVEAGLQQESFYNENDPAGTAITMDVIFNPASFGLKPGDAQRVDTTINIPNDMPAGNYRSAVYISGFDNAFFDLLVEILPQINADIPAGNLESDKDSPEMQDISAKKTRIRSKKLKIT